MTVGELIGRLSAFPHDAEALCYWDSIAKWDIHDVVQNPTSGAVVIDCEEAGRPGMLAEEMAT